jgi:hypothetical protein
VTRAAIALNVDETLDVHLDVLAQVALDVSFVLDHLADAVDLVLAQILDLLEGVNIRLRQNSERARISDAEDVCERDSCLLVAGQIDASNTCHSNSFAASGLCASGLSRFARVKRLTPRGSSQALTQAN